MKIKKKIIGHETPKSIKKLHRRLHWGKQHDRKNVNVLVKDLGLEHGNSVQKKRHLL